MAAAVPGGRLISEAAQVKAPFILIALAVLDRQAEKLVALQLWGAGVLAPAEREALDKTLAVAVVVDVLSSQLL
jgi:hypothetical protein